jgi:hypothetical protein
VGETVAGHGRRLGREGGAVSRAWAAAVAVRREAGADEGQRRAGRDGLAASAAGILRWPALRLAILCSLSRRRLLSSLRLARSVPGA